jgi:hypothetical protein
MWEQLKELCSYIRLKNTPHRVKWLLTKSEIFTVKSLYMYLIASRVNFPTNFLGL